jgi:hypothetical protein
MNRVEIKRGTSVDQTLYYTTENGQFTCLLVDNVKEKGQTVCYSPAKIISEISPFERFGFDESGSLTFESQQQVTITNLWHKYLVSNSGEVLELSSESMRVNLPDTLEFVGGLGSVLTCQLVNGRIRKINGFNLMPVFAGDTTEIVYEMPEEAEPDNGYDN